MGLHKRHTHGRLFTGEAAREQLKIRQRDSHSDLIRMHIPEGFSDITNTVSQLLNPGASTGTSTDDSDADSSDDSDNSSSSGSSGSSGGQGAASVVYVTLPQTFSGPAMYSTLTGPSPQVTDAPKSSTDGRPNFYSGAPDASSETSTSTTSTTPSDTPTAANRVLKGKPAAATHTPSATPSAAPDTGMSGGAKAGLAIGIMLGLGLVAALVFLCWRRKRRSAKYHEELHEKHTSFADVGARRAEAGDPTLPSMSGGLGAAATGAGAGAAAAANQPGSPERSAATAPRLSLRPGSSFLPTLGDNKTAGPANPFADNSAQAGSGVPPSNPFAEPRPSFAEPRPSNESLGGATAVGAAGVAGVAAGAAAAGHANEKKHSPNSSWEGSGPPAAAAIPVAANGAKRISPPPPEPNNVHRVQLDFKPSMDDELELVAGALVRLLHEYDDGWALCITMDRSKQGVAPRTCLSKLPLKKRQGPPPPQQGPPRPGPGHPQDARRGPPPGARPSNPPRPTGPPGAMIPRPLTPQQSSPDESTRTPSPEPSQMDASPQSAPQPLKRKPVPGVAM